VVRLQLRAALRRLELTAASRSSAACIGLAQRRRLSCSLFVCCRVASCATACEMRRGEVRVMQCDAAAVAAERKEGRKQPQPQPPLSIDRSMLPPHSAPLNRLTLPPSIRLLLSPLQLDSLMLNMSRCNRLSFLPPPLTSHQSSDAATRHAISNSLCLCADSIRVGRSFGNELQFNPL